MGRKIVVCRVYTVIANQSADWCGNPPVERNQVTITTKNAKAPIFRCFSVHFPSNWGIATTSVRTGLAMTENFGAKPLNNNLSHLMIEQQLT